MIALRCYAGSDCKNKKRGLPAALKKTKKGYYGTFYCRGCKNAVVNNLDIKADMIAKNMSGMEYIKFRINRIKIIIAERKEQERVEELQRKGALDFGQDI